MKSMPYLRGERQWHLQRRRVDNLGFQGQVSHVAWTCRKNHDFFGTDIVCQQNSARKNFRQGADAASADFLSPQLLNARDARLDYQIKRRLVGDG